jgi:acyl-CoA synthetase (NDP forming)
MDAISSLLSPRSIAVVGASADPAKTAGKPVHFLRKHGFKGDIYPVNPRVETIGDLRCFPSVEALPAAPDVGLVLLGADRARDAVETLAKRGAKAAIVLASGYSETGPEGAKRQAELVEAAGKMRLLGPNTIGLVNLTDRLPLSASGALAMDEFPIGPIAVVSQSGGILGSLLSRAAGRGIGLSKLISTGNEADLELADFVEQLADDPQTSVIALYVEAVRNPARFRQAALKAAAAGKPIVAYKIGRSAAGAKAAASHTGALAGSDEVYDVFFRQTGVIRAQSFSDLLDIPLVLASRRKLRGNRVAILTSTGGAGTLVSDNLGLKAFETPAPDPQTAERLRALLPGGQAVLDRNPVDVTLAGLQPEVLRGAMEALLDSTSYDALAIIVGSSGVAAPELMTNAVQASLSRSGKPVIAFVSPHAPRAASMLTACGVPAFNAPESCAVALDALRRAFTWTAPTAETNPPALPAPPTLSGGTLDEAQSKSLFAHYGVPCVRERIVTSPSEAEAAARELGEKVVLKVLSSQIIHKSDVGGVLTNISADTIAARMIAMAGTVERHAGARPDRYLVQEMVAGGVELILGTRRDALGPVILLGAGGTATELFKDTAMRLLPPDRGLSADDALGLIRELKSWPLLDGYRGRPKADVGALAQAIAAFSNMVAALGPRLNEAEINPIFVLGEGRGVRAADGVVILHADQHQHT